MTALQQRQDHDPPPLLVVVSRMPKSARENSASIGGYSPQNAADRLGADGILAKNAVSGVRASARTGRSSVVLAAALGRYCRSAAAAKRAAKPVVSAADRSRAAIGVKRKSSTDASR
jgi:hypothetical protein